MDNKITKKRISDHLEYDWYKYLIIIIAGIALFVFLFSQINSTRDYEDVTFFVSCYNSSDNTFFSSVQKDMNNPEKYDTDKYGENVILEITLETQDPLDGNYGTLLQTHGMITSDVLIIGRKLLDQGGAAGYVELTDELLNDYLLPKDAKVPIDPSNKDQNAELKIGFDINDLEYYYAGCKHDAETAHNDTCRRYGIKVSDFYRMSGSGSYFEMNWRNVSGYNSKYKDAEPENQPDDEFYLIINPSSVNIGKFGKGDSEKGNAQALYIINRFIAYYCYPYGFATDGAN